MKQVVLRVPDNNYHDFINHVRSKFKDIQIKEKEILIKIEVSEGEILHNPLLLSEISQAEDWLSDDDNSRGEVLSIMKCKKGDIVILRVLLS